MAIPDFQSLMLPVLRRLAERSWKTTELIDVIADEHGLNQADRAALLPSGRQRIIANRTHWTLAHLNRAGLVTRVARGEYEASGRGRELLEAAPPRITIAYLHRYPEYAVLRPEVGAEDGDTTGIGPVATGIVTDLGARSGTPEERLEAAERDLKAEVMATLLNRLQTLSPGAFERLIIDVLVGMGYGGTRRDAAERLGRSGDGGIDGVIREDALGLDTIYLQAKRYAADNPVGAAAIQGFAGALLAQGASKGVFVTTSRSSPRRRAKRGMPTRRTGSS